MGIKKISQVVEKIQYQTSDGKKFTNQKQAKDHEKKLDEPNFYYLNDDTYEPDGDYTLEEFLAVAQKLYDTYGKSAIIRHDAGYNNISIQLATMSYKGNPLV